MIREKIVEAKTGYATLVQKGQLIEIIDLEGKQVVDFFATNQLTPEEYLSAGVTIDCNDTLKISTGDSIYSNLYNKMFTIVKDQKCTISFMKMALITQAV